MSFSNWATFVALAILVFVVVAQPPCESVYNSTLCSSSESALGADSSACTRPGIVTRRIRGRLAAAMQTTLSATRASRAARRSILLTGPHAASRDPSVAATPAPRGALPSADGTQHLRLYHPPTPPKLGAEKDTPYLRSKLRIPSLLLRSTCRNFRIVVTDLGTVDRPESFGLHNNYLLLSTFLKGGPPKKKSSLGCPSFFSPYGDDATRRAKAI